jgi:hypothetical protein
MLRERALLCVLIGEGRTTNKVLLKQQILSPHFAAATITLKVQQFRSHTKRSLFELFSFKNLSD